jgi:hypothetical protein
LRRWAAECCEIITGGWEPLFWVLGGGDILASGFHGIGRTMLTTLIIAVLIGLIPAAIAKGKGESFGL